MSSSRRALRSRLVALCTALSVLVPLAAAPAAAAALPSRAASAPVVDRGTVVPRVAAQKARGVERPVSHHVTLGRSGRPAAAIDGNIIGRATGARPAPRIVGPELQSIAAFDGIDAATEGFSFEPPDPWIAASATHLVQSTNGMISITTRAGTHLVSVPTWALFALAPGELDADPRILWDAVHSRWVGVLLSFQEDFSLNYLNLAVSETSDPTGAWDIRSYPYSNELDQPTLPDYPGIASSTDKIVLTANEFSNGVDFVGASVLVVKWSDILAGLSGTPTTWTFADPDVWTIRPAQNISSSATVNLVASDANNVDVLFARLTGTSPTVTFTDLTVATGVTALCGVNQPRQPGDPATIEEALDTRATDAVWRSNKLAFVSTCSASFDQGATFDDYVRVTVLDTSLATPAVVTPNDDSLIGTAGVDSFLGGVGFSGNGTLFVSYSESSSAQFVSARAAVYSGGVWSSSIAVDEGAGTYAGTRWGDYVGVATDPSGSAAVWQSNQVPTADGGWTTRVSRLVLDGTAPIVTGPTQALISGTTLGGFTVPVKVAWTATDSGTGIARSLLSVDQFSTGLFPSGHTSLTSATRAQYWRPVSVSGDYTYRYGVESLDAAGNTSGVVLGPKVTTFVYQQTQSVSYSGTWSTSSSGTYSGGSVKYSSSAGASATFTTSVARSIGFVTYKGSGRGKVRVYVDGVAKTTISLSSSTTKARTIAYVATWATPGTHKIKLVVVSGRVDIDAFVAIRG